MISFEEYFKGKFLFSDTDQSKKANNFWKKMLSIFIHNKKFEVGVFDSNSHEFIPITDRNELDQYGGENMGRYLYFVKY